MIVVPFSRGHLERIRLQPAQEHVRAYFKDVDRFGTAYTALEGDEVLACAGLLPAGTHRAVVWALLGDIGPARFHRVHREVQRFLNRQPYRRVEALVDCGFDEAHRWVRLLGFDCEAERMKAYAPDGRDVALYARVRDGA